MYNKSTADFMSNASIWSTIRFVLIILILVSVSITFVRTVVYQDFEMIEDTP